MAQLKDITVTLNAVRQARLCGLTGDVEARVRGFAAAAVPHQSEVGNAAYGPYIMIIRGTTVLSVSVVGPVYVDRRPISACKLCHGLTILKRGTMARPCPRATNPDAPLCDTLVRKT